MDRTQEVAIIKRKFTHLSEELNERTRRYWAATEAEAIGYGGISIVCEAIAMDHKTVQAGLREITRAKETAPNGRIRRSGGGRKRLTEKDPQLTQALDALVEPTTRGDPESPLRWTTKSTLNLAEELTKRGHPASYRTINRLLAAERYSMQLNKKNTRRHRPP